MSSLNFSIGGSALGVAMLATVFQTHAQSTDAASCGAMTIGDQCRISWNFSRASNSYYFVQQFDPLQTVWRTVIELPVGTPAQGTFDNPVEGGQLYRVLACDDAGATMSCSGSTMVWAPFIQPEDQVHLIPSRIALAGSEMRFGKPVYGRINKEFGWLGQVIQYNVYLMGNAIARASISDLPEMTPVADIRLTEPDNPVDQIHFNVYWAYSAERGIPLESSMPEQVPRGPHEHSERHSQ